MLDAGHYKAGEVTNYRSSRKDFAVIDGHFFSAGHFMLTQNLDAAMLLHSTTRLKNRNNPGLFVIRKM